MTTGARVATAARIQRHSISPACRYLGAGEWYGVRAEVWRAANMPKGGYLCIGCLERRLRRRLVRTDFKAPDDITDLETPRLIDRMTTTGKEL